ncbi:hypothetical protein EYC80_001810 [Monilinia laxa]|uniref:Uncharacterized protein n=1 Tax=Monilinia laxa TaxID=61186 RepID=A0A5N6K618_MONLA|nr:hypothetical protein EYC80_001810 [Monilinia laxa]
MILPPIEQGIDIDLGKAQEVPIDTSKSFKHRTLDLQKTQIRLFRLLPGKSDRYLKGTIAIHDFDSPDCPGYKAVSYTWGPTHPTRDIDIDGKIFTIRENLWHFLNSIPNSKIPWYDSSKGWEQVKEGWLWIDQICIDQSAVEERNHQVNLMAKIYTKASSVLLWLGPEADGSNEAMEAIKTGSDSIIQCEKQVKSLFRRNYWSRLWILQEILIGKNILVLCGSKSVSWRGLVTLFLPPRYESGDKPWKPSISIDSVALSLILEKTSPSNGNQRLSYMLDTFAGLQCEDSRDKVYGLLSLVRSSGTIPVDYSKSPKVVLFTAIETIIEDESFMAIESHCNTGMRLRDRMMMEDINDQAIRNFIEKKVNIIRADTDGVVEGNIKKDDIIQGNPDGAMEENIKKDNKKAAAKFNLAEQWTNLCAHDITGQYYFLDSRITQMIWKSYLTNIKSRFEEGKDFIIEEQKILEFSEQHHGEMRKMNTVWNGLVIHDVIRTALALAEYKAILQRLTTPTLRRGHFEQIAKLVIAKRSFVAEDDGEA